MGDSAYSFSLTTFSRTGKLLQIEYALNAVANGRTALGIAATDGVVIATDKKFSSSLVEGEDVQKVERITKGSGFVYSGVGPDYRVLGELLGVVNILLFTHMVIFFCVFLIPIPSLPIINFTCIFTHTHTNKHSTQSEKISPSILPRILRNQTCRSTSQIHRLGNARIHSIGRGTTLRRLAPSRRYRLRWITPSIPSGSLRCLLWMEGYRHWKKLCQCQKFLGKTLPRRYGIGGCNSYGIVDVEGRV